jgi:hypothetical protein
MKEITVHVDDDTYNYLEFLERTRYIKNKDQALNNALIFFKKLSMHDWLPDIYRIGENRVIVMDRGMLLDLFESLTEYETYRAGSMTAIKRKVLRPEFRDLNLTKKANWPLVLKELENLGWGKFERVEDEIMVENSAFPPEYLRGYLETMFKVRLNEHKTSIQDLIIFQVADEKVENWL